MGNLNKTPGSAALKPLYVGTAINDVFVHPLFSDGGHPGTFRLCNASNKIDFSLLSHKLFSTVQQGGVWRAGMWPGKLPVRWTTYSELEKPVHAGSDHACIWVDIDV